MAADFPGSGEGMPTPQNPDIPPSNAESEQRAWLTGVAATLRASKYFNNYLSGAPLLSEKQTIFLVAAGEKPGGIVTNQHPLLRFRRRDQLDAGAVELLDSIGLASLPDPRERSTFFIAKTTPEELKAKVAPILEKTGPEGMVAEGKFCGYPLSAVYTFAYDDPEDIVPLDELRRILSKNGLPTEMPPFAFSRSRWEDELAEWKKQYAVLDEYGLT